MTKQEKESVQATDDGLVPIKALKRIATGSIGKEGQESTLKIYEKGETFRVSKEEAARLCKLQLDPKIEKRMGNISPTRQPGRGASAEYI